MSKCRKHQIFDASDLHRRTLQESFQFLLSLKLFCSTQAAVLWAILNLNPNGDNGNLNKPEINKHTVHIWHIIMSDHPPPAHYLELLSDAEQQRIVRYRDDSQRHQQLHLRLVLRKILASYLKLSAAQLKLTRTVLDKPILAPGCYPLDLRFNLSHSGCRAVLAVTCDRDIGVDLEQETRPRNVVPLARRYFSESIVRALQRHQGQQQLVDFLRLWTQYEAYKKAQGLGLRGNESKLTLSAEPFPANQFRPLFDAPGQWQTATLALPAGWLGAVVVANEQARQRLQIIDYYHDSAGQLTENDEAKS